MALWDLSGATSLKDDEVGHYLATWALSCPLALQHFNHDVKHINVARCTHTTFDTCKAGVEA